jgi:hypothetical protein
MRSKKVFVFEEFETFQRQTRIEPCKKENTVPNKQIVEFKVY